ncbi:LTA synthase family protein [Peptoniphilus sp. KCTC 25270]|uniref:LTA synthase family protein n=1 Tax=Peptoniphilus sp. KCTC 25270 TaxID=2897414 RepID=UPI001E44B180|nr:LTA synthase family protein [Peptoniphilus sp. KCTC 25270]MCD1146665.1 LTA synthase family protein [Peptoniphilus sp. KCTC 25270]
MNRKTTILHTIGHILLYFVISMGLSVMTNLFSYIDTYITWDWWKLHPWIVIANGFPLFLGMLILHGLSRKITIPIGVATAFTILFSFANKLKVVNRQEPIFLADLVLVREATRIVSEGDYITPIMIQIGIIGFALLIGFFLLPIPKYKLNLLGRLGFVIAPLCIGIVSLFLIYNVDSPFAKKVPRMSEVEMNKSLTFQEQGIIYSLLTYRHVNRIERPEPYVPSDIQDYVQRFQKQDPKIKADIVMIMGEAWGDISEKEGFRFYRGKDPFSILRPLKKNLIGKGQIITPTFGGGTSNTEYESLTGHSTLQLSKNPFTAYSTVRGPVDSLPKLLRGSGYNTFAMHPGHRWFYNREKVYENLGFNKSVFVEDFENPKLKGRYVSERETTDRLFEELDALKEESNPYFALTVTIQNHSPYDFDKYGKELNTFDFVGADLTEEEKIGLEAYFEGIRDMNRSIIEITEYLNQTVRPTIFLYFGDHLPSLGSGYSLFDKIGYYVDEGTWKGIIDVYRTPYILWGNDAYYKAMEDKKIELPEEVSSQYLPTMILESMGGESMDPFFEFLTAMRKDMPVYHRYFYKDSQLGFNSVGNENSRQVEELVRYRTWEYMRGNPTR